MGSEIRKGKSIFNVFCIFGVLVIIMNIFFISSPNVKPEGSGLEIHINEIGFSSEFVDTLSTTLYCPRFEQNEDWETRITLTNPYSQDANIVINYYNDEGILINQINYIILSLSNYNFISSEHGISEQSGSIVINSDLSLFGNIIYYSNYCAASEPLQILGSSKLYCPGYIQTPEWNTWICINNIGENSNDLTITYYDEQGNEINSIYKTLSSNKNIYFKPINDGIFTSFGSLIIDAGINGNIIGYVLKINYEYSKAYSFTLLNNLDDTLSNEFITNECNQNEIILFNPNSNTQNLDIFIYDETGFQINSIDDLEIYSFHTIKLLINDFDEDYTFGSLLIESDLNGVVGYFGLIGPNYGLAHSIHKSNSNIFYCSLESYKNYQDESIIFQNPTESELETEVIYYGVESEEEGMPIDSFSGNNQFFGKVCGEIQNGQIYPIYYDKPYWASCLANPNGPPGGGEDFGFNPNWLSSPDSDNDGLQDHIEDRLFKATIPMTDTDGDGVADGRNDPDTDGDDLPDGWEYKLLGGKQPIKDSNSPNGKYDDPDGDSLTNWFEYTFNIDPNWDTDPSDGTLSDGVYWYGIHPKKYDTDDDMLYDWLEINANAYTSNPRDSDSDDDRLYDGFYDSNNNYQYDSFEYGEDRSIDGYLGSSETDPTNPDSDDDGRPDGIEAFNGLNPKQSNVKWTIMIYMDGDNDLEYQSILNFQELEEIGSTDDITIIVQIDRIGFQDLKKFYKNEYGLSDSDAADMANEIDDTSFGDWSDTRRFLVLKDSDKNNWKSYRLDSKNKLGELGVGSDNTLENFIKFGINNFPASNYALIFWDHGSACFGCCVDFTSINDPNDDGNALFPQKLRNGLKSGTNNGANKFDIIGFDCCLMANWEIMYQIEDYGKLVVASENYEWGYDDGNIQLGGWPYDLILSDFIQNHDLTWSKEDFSKRIVDKYIEAWTDSNLDNDFLYSSTPTMSVLKLNKVNGLKNKLHVFATELKDAMEDTDLGLSYKFEFGGSKNVDWGGIPEVRVPETIFDMHLCVYDVYYYADWWVQNLTKMSPTDPYYSNLIQYANDIKDYVLDDSSNKIVYYEKHGDYWSGTPGPLTGLGIYLPFADSDGNYWNDEDYGERDFYISELEWAKDCYWDDMIDVKYPPSS